MVLNYIWIAFFLIAFVVALIRVFGYIFRDFLAENFSLLFDITDLNVFYDIIQSSFEMSKIGFEISLYLTGAMTLWLGILKIGENGGMIGLLSKLIAPFFQKLFPEIPKNHPVFGTMIMNFSANMLGLDNAATPMGLKAMNELQELNTDKQKASNAQIMFLVLNTSGLTIIPVSIMVIRAQQGATNPSDVFIPILLTTFFSTFTGLLVTSFIQKINLFNKVILGYGLVVSCLISGIIYHFYHLDKATSEVHSSFISGFILFLVMVSFIALSAYKKVNVYDSFIEGAKEGFGIAIKIIPFLIAILVAIGVFRASGAMDYLMLGIKQIVYLFSDKAQFVDALPTAIMKPLSGSGSRGMMVDAMNQFGVDSFVGRLASVFQGSTDTTFYVIAVYFGSVGIKNTRYAVGAGLLADLAGIVAAIVFSYIFFS